MALPTSLSLFHYRTTRRRKFLMALSTSLSPQNYRLQEVSDGSVYKSTTRQSVNFLRQFAHDQRPRVQFLTVPFTSSVKERTKWEVSDCLKTFSQIVRFLHLPGKESCETKDLSSRQFVTVMFTSLNELTLWEVSVGSASKSAIREAQFSASARMTYKSYKTEDLGYRQFPTVPFIRLPSKN